LLVARVCFVRWWWMKWLLLLTSASAEHLSSGLSLSIGNKLAYTGAGLGIAAGALYLYLRTQSTDLPRDLQYIWLLIKFKRSLSQKVCNKNRSLLTKLTNRKHLGCERMDGGRILCRRREQKSLWRSHQIPWYAIDDAFFFPYFLFCRESSDHSSFPDGNEVRTYTFTDIDAMSNRGSFRFLL